MRRMFSPDVLGSRISRVFDAPYYLATNPDVAQAGVIPLAHYMEFGWKEFRDPSPWFSVSWYLRTYPDVAAAGVEPLRHYLSAGAAEGRSPIANFDTIYYSAHAVGSLRPSETAIEHFLRVGATCGLRTHAPHGASQGGDSSSHAISTLVLSGWCPTPGLFDLALQTISAHAEAEPDLRGLPVKLARLPVQPFLNAKADHAWRSLFQSLRARPDILVMVGNLDDVGATEFLVHLAEAAPQREILAVAVDEKDPSVGLALPDAIETISLAEFETGEGKALRERLAVALVWSLRPKVVAVLDSPVMREVLLRNGATIRRHMRIIVAMGEPEPDWAEVAELLGSADLVMAGAAPLSEDLRRTHAIPCSAIGSVWPLRPDGAFDRALLRRALLED
jgi:hypothetical protein